MSGRAGRSGRKSADARQTRKRFLIVCEGERTEPNYFKAFPIAGQVVIVGTGYNTLSLVEEAERLVKQHAKQSTTYDKVWCVFDKDSFTDEAFNAAVARVALLADKEGPEWGAAWSNESFELWYVLHFGLLQSALHRSVYIERLKEMLGSYKKKDPLMYDKLRHLMPTAIAHAETLAAMHDDLTPAAACRPCTRVVDLVKRLHAAAHQ